MTDAPERIWAEPWYHTDPATRRWDDEEWFISLEPDGTAIEWVRADLHADRIEELEAQVREMEDILRTVAFRAQDAKRLCEIGPPGKRLQPCKRHPRPDWRARRHPHRREAMSRESKATKEEIQRNREEAYLVGWDDGYAEGYGKAGADMRALAAERAKVARLVEALRRALSDIRECSDADMAAVGISEAIASVQTGEKP